VRESNHERTVVITASVATLATIFVQEARAEGPIESQVPPAVLQSLSLGGLQPLSDESAMTVRGASSFVVTGGSSFVWGQLQYMGQVTTYTRVRRDSSHSFDSAANPAPNMSSQVTTIQGSSISYSTPAFPVFSGSFSGFAGSTVSPFAGFATAFGQ